MQHNNALIGVLEIYLEMTERSQPNGHTGSRNLHRTSSLTDRQWTRPDLPSKCTWKPGTKEKDPHEHIIR